jgi:hypothetical protein
MQVVPLQHIRLRSVVPVLTLAAAYAVAAWLELWLAIPPGYAMAVGPASGGECVHGLLRDVGMGFAVEPVMDRTGLRDGALVFSASRSVWRPQVGPSRSRRLRQDPTRSRPGPATGPLDI